MLKLSLYLPQIQASLIFSSLLGHKTDLVHHFTNGASESYNTNRVSSGLGTYGACDSYAVQGLYCYDRVHNN